MIRNWHLLRMIPRAPRKTTASELVAQLSQDGFEVTKRTIERELHNLAEIFPLICDDRSKPYGWSWSRDARAFDLPGMSFEEAVTLNLVQRHLNNLLPPSLLKSLQHQIVTADAVLQAAAGSHKKRPWNEKVAATSGWMNLQPVAVDSEIQATICEALLHEWQLKIRYDYRGSKKQSEWIIQPLGLVQRGQILYLIVRIHDSEPRTLAMHRISMAEILYQPVQWPPQFRLQAYLDAGNMEFRQGDLMQIQLRFYERAGEHLLETPLSANQQVKELDDGTIEVKATVHDTPQLFWWILGFGAKIEVLYPSKLRNKIAHQLTSAAKYYE